MKADPSYTPCGRSI